MKFDEPVLQSLSQKEMKNMQSRLDGLAKPVKSLGRLEELAVHLAGIYRTCNFTVQPRTCLVFAADNGVVKEGVSATPKAVTAIQAVNMVNGHTAVAALARAYNSKIEVFDVGIDSDKALPGVHCCKIRRSTNDMLLKPAMSYAQAVKAVLGNWEWAIPPQRQPLSPHYFSCPEKKLWGKALIFRIKDYNIKLG